MANSYGFDPVAWSIDGGRHRGELLRVLAYAATSGAEGIISPTDCLVHQLQTPGSQVSIDLGALLIRNRSANVRNQTYVANARTESRLDVAPTGSQSGRSDLVVVRVEDPQYSPWPQPASSAAPTYQYVKPFIIQNVPAGTTSAKALNLGYSAVALARLDIPQNTSTITNAMIVDLRQVAQPRRKRIVRVYKSTGEATLGTSGTTVPPNSGRLWFPSTNVPVECPDWATRLQLTVSYNGLFMSRSLTGNTRAEYGWAPGDSIGYGSDGLPCIATGYTGIHYSGADQDRRTVVVAGDMPIPTDYRGKVHYVRTGTSNNAGSQGYMAADQWTTMVVDLEFVEVAE